MAHNPTGWIDPVTGWVATDVPLPADLNRIEGNQAATETGSRTIDPTQAPSSSTGSLQDLLNWFAYQLKALSGGTNWYDAAAATLSTLWGKFNATTGHAHTGGTNDAPQIGTAGLADNAVTAAKMADATITGTQLADGAVVAGAIATGGVSALTQIASGLKTSAGGTEADVLAVTNGSGKVGAAIAADTVGGYSPGNGSGDVPVSNGTANTNLLPDLTLFHAEDPRAEGTQFSGAQAQDTGTPVSANVWITLGSHAFTASVTSRYLIANYDVSTPAGGYTHAYRSVMDSTAGPTHAGAGGETLQDAYDMGAAGTTGAHTVYYEFEDTTVNDYSEGGATQNWVASGYRLGLAPGAA